MTLKLPDDAIFAEEFQTIGPKGMAQKYEVALNNVYMHRRRVEARIGRPIHAPRTLANGYNPDATEDRICLDLQDGVIIVASDCHYWHIVSTAHRALLKACQTLKPAIVCMNGDVFDGASVSRWPAGSFTEAQSRPTVREEIDFCTERLKEVEEAAKEAKLIWTLGNHDARFEARLASVASEYADLPGFSLRDHFPAWRHAWSLWINDEIVIKHRFKGGIFATHNNTLWAGKTMVTGHLHSLKVTPFTDYNGTRFGVDTGTLAPVYGPQFQSYMEDGPRNWREGFVVLTVRDGKLLWPELVHVIEHGKVEFRGKVWDVEN